MLGIPTSHEAQSAALELERPARAVSLRLASPAQAAAVVPRHRLRVTGGALAGADFLAACGTLLALRSISVPMTVTAAVLVAAAAALSGALSGVYGRTALRLHKTRFPEAAGLLQMGLLVAVLLALVSVRPPAGLELAAATTTLVSVVALARRVLQRLGDSSAAGERCLLIGDPVHTREFQRQLDAAGTKLDIAETVPLTRVGGGLGSRAVEDLIAQHDADRVVVLADDAVDRAAQAARRARNAGATVTLVPRVAATLGAEIVPELIGGHVALSARPAELTSVQRRLKRALDLLGATLILLAIAPLVAIIAAAVKLTSDGPVLFCQQRVGRDGRVFRIKKFRTMVKDAEALKADLRHRNEADGLFKMAADPRITTIGRLLRKTSLDELPQLLNVLAGQMSLVGPRPLVPDEDGMIEGWHRDRLRLAPGMTGPWQVMGSARIGLRDMVLLDHHYVSNWSLWGDVQMLVRTAGVVLTRRGM